jgi:ATP-binding cassette subfamily B protein
MQGRVDVGVLFAFVAYEGMLLWPVRQLGRLLTELGKARVSMGRLREILHQSTEEGLPAAEAMAAGAPVACGTAALGCACFPRSTPEGGRATWVNRIGSKFI